MSKDFVSSGCRQMTGCAGSTLGRGANYFKIGGRRKGWYI